MKNIKLFLDEIYIRYNQMANMSHSDLLKWSKNPLSKKVSRNRNSLFLNLRLKSRKKKEWTLSDIKGAIKIISHIKQAKNIKSKRINGNKATRKQLILKNWGYDIKKKKKQSFKYLNFF